MRWTLRYSHKALAALYQIPREIWAAAKVQIWALQDNPVPDRAQPDEEDPSIYWLALPGDYVASYEIIDEEHVIVLLDIE